MQLVQRLADREQGKVGPVKLGRHIGQFNADVSPAGCGRPLLAFISLAMAYERYPVASAAEREFASQLADMDDVLECYRITGEDCYLLLVAVPDLARLEETVSRLGALGRTRTSLVLSTPMRRRPILPAGLAGSKG